MRIFVTGATGFVGGHFVERALEAGHDVVGIYNSKCSQKQKFTDHLRSLGAELHPGDVLHPDSFVDRLADSDCVCHFAAAFRESGVKDDYFRRINVDGTVNVLKAAAAAGARRFVLCSTAGIYGQRNAATIDESVAPRPWNIYETTKLASEHEVRTLSTKLGIEYVILRPTAVYGPRDERLLKLFRSAIKGRFPLFGRGEGRRHMVYVTDLADAFLRACTEPGAASQELIVGGPRAVPLHELLSTLADVLKRKQCGPRLPLRPMLGVAALMEDLCKVLGVQPPIYRRRMDFYLNDVAFDCGRARAVLKWQPRVDLPDGLACTLEAYRAQGRLASSASFAIDYIGAITQLTGLTQVAMTTVI